MNANNSILNDRFQIPVILEQFQSRFVAFIQSDAAAGAHVLSHSENIAEVRATPPVGLEAYVADAEAAEVVLSDRKERVVIPEVAGPLPTIGELGPWKLTVESHGPASNDSVESTVETIEVSLRSCCHGQRLRKWRRSAVWARKRRASTSQPGLRATDFEEFVFGWSGCGPGTTQGFCGVSRHLGFLICEASCELLILDHSSGFRAYGPSLLSGNLKTSQGF